MLAIIITKNENPLISEIAFWFFVVSLILCLLLYLHAFSSNICVDTRWISPSMYPLLTFVKIGVWIKNMYQVKPVPVTFDVVMLYIQICACCFSVGPILESISNFVTNLNIWNIWIDVFNISFLIIIVCPLYTNSRSSFASHYASHFVQGMLLFI